jgi:hypothetical protein
MQEAWAAFRPELATLLKLAADEMVYCGMAVGHPNPANPVNGFERHRMSVEELADLRGF